MIKDEILSRLAAHGNVAQFASFSPALEARYTVARGEVDGDPRTAAEQMLAYSCAQSVNIRSFIPGDHQSKEFVYGLKSVDDVVANLNRLGSQGLYLIINETIDVNDGGVSGVAQGDLIEFAPNDTPRCVEKPGACSLPRVIGDGILQTVYRTKLGLNGIGRSEFSVHPLPCGNRGERVILWEYEETAPHAEAAPPSWPNRFSQHIGDKAFGLLVADALGLPVPETLVVGRNVAPFSFGSKVGDGSVWARTCPVTQQPGLYTTVKGWTDPFKLMATEDADGTAIASVLSQSAIPALYAGAAIYGADGEWIIEGKGGEGDDFMLGSALPQPLPPDVIGVVNSRADEIISKLGPARFEWVFDGKTVWVVQLHSGQSCSSATVVVPGDAEVWREVETSDLAKLRDDIAALPNGHGAILLGRFGLTSHIADVVRKAGKPARLAA